MTKDDPPFLIVHGDKDPLVPHNQSEILCDALKKAGVEATLYTVPGGGHGGFKDPQVRHRRIGSVFLLLTNPQFHRRPFPIFANTVFLRALILVVALFAAAWLARRGGQKLPKNVPAAAILELLGILVLWIVMTEDIWGHYRLGDRPTGGSRRTCTSRSRGRCMRRP